MKHRGFLFQAALLVLFVFCFSGPILPTALAQDPSTEEVEAGDDDTLATLGRLSGQIRELDQEIADLRAQGGDANTDEQKAEIEKQIVALKNERGEWVSQFEELATGVRRELLYPEEEQMTLQEQFQQLLNPVVEAVEDATANTREIENLKSEIAELEVNLGLIEEGVKNLERLAEESTGDLQTLLREQVGEWQALLTKAQSELQANQLQLKKRQQQNKGVVQGASEGIQSFFRNRGFNLFTALATFFIVFWLLRLAYPWVKRLSPVHRGEKSFFSRCVDVLYTAFTIFVSLLAALISLFIAGDWLLLSIFALIGFGLIWSARNSIPPFLEEIRLILNIGPVREGERIVYEGIPWKVSKLALYCRLTNPELAGGLVRLPAKTLLSLASRPFEKDEGWFPTSKGDWVELSDETYGKVVVQTPEYVQVLEKGGARKTFSTGDFLALAPRNLSHNFRISSAFGIDYDHQDISTSEIPGIFKEALHKAIIAEFGKDALVNLGVEFSLANASSLDYQVLADFHGSQASNFQQLTRFLQKACVDVCNDNNWGIPFQQITIHQAQ